MEEYFPNFHRMAVNFKNILRKTRRWGLRILLTGLALVFLLEVFYRYQIIDTYRREVNFLNPQRGVERPGKRVLVMGDSFSAAPENWVDQLRKLRPDLNILNAAVPGTGVRQANFMASRRFSEQSPEIFIYQIYLGNDLFDLRYPLNWREGGLFRTMYWAAANRLRGIGWFNYALGQFRAAPPASGSADGKTTDEAFDPKKFSPRERLYLKVEPDLISNSALLLGDRKSDFEDYLDHLDDLVVYCESGSCRVMLLVIPHCAQVNEVYLEKMKDVGAKIPDPHELMNFPSPFFNGLSAHFSESPHVTLLDPTQAIHKLEHSGPKAFYNNDIHLTPAGQKAMAEMVAAYLALGED